MIEATIDYKDNASDVMTLIRKIKDLHGAYPLCGKKRNALLDLPDDQLAYLIAMMKSEPASSPNLTPAQWDELLEQLKPHWVIPLLYSYARAQQPESQPPAETMTKLSYSYRSSQMESVKTENQLKEILDTFRSAGVRALVLKGTAIAYAYYQDHATRPSADIDLLVDPEDVVRARKALESLGYACKEKSFEISRKLYNEEAFTNQSRPRYKIVEIHWNLYISCDVDVSQLFDRAVPVMRGDFAFETLHPVDAILYNALHMLMHHDDDVRLSWIYDVAMIARNLAYPGGWQALQEKSLEYGATRSVQVTLKMAELWTGLRLPSGFDDLSLWPQPGKKEQAALSHLYLGRSELMFDKIRFQWYCSSGPLEKVSLINFLLFPPIEMMRNEFPGSSDWMLPINFVRRWIRLLGRLIIDRGSARVHT